MATSSHLSLKLREALGAEAGEELVAIVDRASSDTRPRGEARRAIEQADQVYVSAISAWEIAIKTGLGRLKPRRTVADAIADSGFEELPLRLHHLEGFGRLPMHHRDPFDRALIGQAMVDRLTIVSRDPAFRRDDVPVIVA